MRAKRSTELQPDSFDMPHLLYASYSSANYVGHLKPALNLDKSKLGLFVY